MRDNNSMKTQWSGFDFFEETPGCLEKEVNINDEACDAAKCFPLAMASVGECLRIARLKGSEGTVRRFISMGFVPGCQVQIISVTGGSVIVGIGDNRIGLGAGMAQKIMCTNEFNRK
ncbi:FeoA [Rivularia sp. IAM M-261]|nr:FeoA [Rivularia sp. IAM M-261]